RDRLSVSDVPAYYHATTAGGDFLGNGLAPDGALFIQPTHCVKSRLDNVRRTGHTSALLLISFLNERANQRNGNEHNSNFFS
ncbi:hypothetical protein R3X43_26545, partial [Salmonella enterica subsp. enterica serovar Typhimurium]